MTALKPLLLMLGLAVAAIAADPNQAQAQCKGSFIIRNSSNVPIHYQVKWGDDSEWKSYCVTPGCRRSHYHDLDGNGRAPAPHLRFDHVAGDGETTFKCYNMSFCATHDHWNGLKNVFRYSGCGCYLDLYRE